MTIGYRLLPRQETVSEGRGKSDVRIKICCAVRRNCREAGKKVTYVQKKLAEI